VGRSPQEQRGDFSGRRLTGVSELHERRTGDAQVGVEPTTGLD
jgi:hypothetical protein